jgi:hypothetical protein
MELFWVFSALATPAIYFFKKLFEIFSLDLFWNRSCVVRKKGAFCAAFASRGKSKTFG